MCMHKGELANINPPRITTEPIIYKPYKTNMSGCRKANSKE